MIIEIKTIWNPHIIVWSFESKKSLYMHFDKILNGVDITSTIYVFFLKIAAASKFHGQGNLQAVKVFGSNSDFWQNNMERMNLGLKTFC